METSVTIIGIIILIIIGIPLYFVFRAQSVNKTKIKKILQGYQHYHFGKTDAQNKKALYLDDKKKGFLLLDFNYEPEQVSFVNLKEVNACKLIPTTQGNSNTIINIGFEFQYKDAGKKESVPFYNIEKDQIGQVCLYEDHQLAKKWQQLISDCILS
jgi:hypothetical protein